MPKPSEFDNPSVSLYYTNMYRISKLLASGRALFHINDLAVLWGITNRHTLHVAIHRYLKRGILIPVYRGLYVTKPIDSIDPRLIGMAVIHAYSYLSCERVLADEGIIPQQIIGYTFVSGKSKTVTVGDHVFRYRTLAERFLYHPAGVYMDEVGVIATAPRANADLCI
jgi:predicted transcriptional regulator of viral defense system